MSHPPGRIYECGLVDILMQLQDTVTLPSHLHWVWFLAIQKNFEFLIFLINKYYYCCYYLFIYLFYWMGLCTEIVLSMRVSTELDTGAVMVGLAYPGAVTVWSSLDSCCHSEVLLGSVQLLDWWHWCCPVGKHVTNSYHNYISVCIFLYIIYLIYLSV